MRRVAIAAVLCCTLSATSFAHTVLPTLFAGDGVSNGDVIDIHADPDDDSPIIAHIPSDSRDIEVVAFDKGRGPGGRMSRRRGAGGDFEHGGFGFVPFSTQVGDSIEEVPGVTLVSRIRQTAALVNGVESLVTGVEPETITQMQTTGIGSAALSPGGIVVDSETAAEEGLSVGDTVMVTWSGGVTDSLVLQGTYERQAALATSSGWGVPLATMEEAWLPAVDSFLFALLDPEADVDAARVEFDQIQAAYPTVQILDQTEFKESITGEINQLLSVVYALLMNVGALALVVVARRFVHRSGSQREEQL